jgi:heme exporter protein A
MEPASLIATDLACRRGERLLFRGLSFALVAGEALQVIGPNGTGKSSLLRILAGLLSPWAGTVERTVEAALLDERLALDGDLPLGKALAFWERVDGVRYGLETPLPRGEGLGAGVPTSPAAPRRHRARTTARGTTAARRGGRQGASR